MPGRGFSCRRCAHCCLALSDASRGCVSDGDLARWKRAGRSDILAHISTLDLGRGNVLHLAWVDPQTGEDAERCPWLREQPRGAGHLCGIEEVKPDHCRRFPESRSHAAQTGCPGYSSPANNAAGAPFAKGTENG